MPGSQDCARGLGAGPCPAPGTGERLAALGAEPLVGPPQDVTTLICNDRERWAKVIQEGNVKPG
jgi:hypothetical protein